MAVNEMEANAYIQQYCIDVEDWTEADAAKKLRIVNVASRTLTTKYSAYTIPDSAVYEFANVLATVFNDTARYAQQGVTALSLTGTASFDFKESAVMTPGSDIAKYIPQSALDIISAANDGIKLAKRHVVWTVI